MPRKKLPPVPKNHDRMIIKIQRPLYMSDQEPQVLIYNEDQTISTFLPYDDAMKDLFGEDLKQYWIADLPTKTKGFIKLQRQVVDPGW